jgi:hypothetical protein
MIKNQQLKIKNRAQHGKRPLHELIGRSVGPDALRWYVAGITDEELTLEVTSAPSGQDVPPVSVDERVYPGKVAALSIIPTGVGCEIGGYAGEASPATNLLAAAVDYLITNPNAVNASDFFWPRRCQCDLHGWLLDRPVLPRPCRPASALCQPHRSDHRESR